MDPQLDIPAHYRQAISCLQRRMADDGRKIMALLEESGAGSEAVWCVHHPELQIQISREEPEDLDRMQRLADRLSGLLLTAERAGLAHRQLLMESLVWNIRLTDLRAVIDDLRLQIEQQVGG